MHWYYIFIHEMQSGPQAHMFEGANFFITNWGALTCIAGICGEVL